MDTNPRYTIVGLVIVVLIAALFFWVSWLWRGDSQNKIAYYAIYFSKQSLSGLQIDSVVTMRGIKVGNVKTIAIQPQDIERVRVRIALNLGTPVRTDTRAVITRNLLTGLAGIDLVGSTQAAAALPIVLAGEDLPTIQEGRTGLEQVQQSAPELIGKAGDTLGRLELLLSNENIEKISKTLQNLEQGTTALTQLGPVLTSADKTLITLNELLKESKGKIAPALNDFSDMLRSLEVAANNFSKDVSAMSQVVITAGDRLKEPRSSVLGLASGKLGPGEEKGK